MCTEGALLLGRAVRV